MEFVHNSNFQISSLHLTIGTDPFTLPYTRLVYVGLCCTSLGCSIVVKLTVHMKIYVQVAPLDVSAPLV